MSSTKSLAIGSSAPPAFLSPPFTIDAARRGNTFVVRAEGELDLSECPVLERALREAEASYATRILLDLEGLTFIDAAGLSALVLAWHRSVANGNRLRVTRGRGNVAGMLHLTALDTVLPFIADS
jgi:anti-sigma B factor antagonist